MTASGGHGLLGPQLVGAVLGFVVVSPGILLPVRLRFSHCLSSCPWAQRSSLTTCRLWICSGDGRKQNHD